MSQVLKTDSLQIGKVLETNKPFTIGSDFVTKSANILSRKGKGKTYTAGVLEEELAKNKIPFIVLDPMGAHFGIKSGYPVHVFGGDHGDLPLDESIAGEIAELIVSTNISAIIDLVNLPKTRMRSFVARFVDRLYEINQTPRHVFVEECDIFAPQKLFPETTKCYEAIDFLVRRGRQKGLGSTLISQRPAVVNKDVLSQADLQIFLQIGGPQDLKAVKDMLSHDVDKKEIESILKRIKHLGIGEALFYSPDPEETIRTFVKIRERTTFHAGATPTLVKKQDIGKQVQVDVEAIRTKLENIIESNKPVESGPKGKGRKELERVGVFPVGKVVKELKDQLKGKDDIIEEMKRTNQDLLEGRDLIVKENESLNLELQQFREFQIAFQKLLGIGPGRAPDDPKEKKSNNDNRSIAEVYKTWMSKLPSGQAKIIEALLEFPGERRTVQQISFLTHQTRKTTEKYISNIKTKTPLIDVTREGVMLKTI